jgi:hypothetical protein
MSWNIVSRKLRSLEKDSSEITFYSGFWVIPQTLPVLEQIYFMSCHIFSGVNSWPIFDHHAVLNVRFCMSIGLSCNKIHQSIIKNNHKLSNIIYEASSPWTPLKGNFVGTQFKLTGFYDHVECMSTPPTYTLILITIVITHVRNEFTLCAILFTNTFITRQNIITTFTQNSRNRFSQWSYEPAWASHIDYITLQ